MMRRRADRKVTLAGVMVGVGLVGLALGFARAFDAPPQARAILAAGIGAQYLGLFFIVFVLGPKRPEG